MNLVQAISFSELLAGGPGSGCHGPNCGRPKGGIENFPTGGAHPKLEDQRWAAWLTRQQMLSPNIAHTKDGKVIREGDIVKIQKPFVLWNEKTGNNDKFQPGLKAKVMHILPKVGNVDQMLSLNVQKKGHEDDRVHMKIDDVKLHKSTGGTIEPQPVPKSQVKQSFLSNDGSRVTIVRTPETREYNPRTIKDLANQPSRYKGQFEKIEKVNGADGNITRVYDTSKVPSGAWGRGGPSTAAPRPGVTLWVHRYSDHVTIQEQSYQRWGFKTAGRIEWQYKNVGQAFGMLKRRYGISIPLSKERF